MTVLFAARFGSPEEPVVVFAGARARALVEDAARLFGTLDALGCSLDRLRAMSLNEQSLVIADLPEPVESLTPFLMMAERLGVDVVDDAPPGERHHAVLERPAHVQTTEVALLSEDYFQLRFPNGREPTGEELARALCLVGRYDRAAELLRDEARSRPDDAPLHFHVGNLLERAGKPEEAIPFFRRSAELAPNQLDPRSSLALALVSCGKHREAKDVYQELVELGGGDFGDWMNLATVCCDTGDLDEGRRAVAQALAKEPTSSHAHALAAVLAASAGDRPAAERHSEQAERALATADRDSPIRELVEDLVRKARDHQQV